MGEGEDDEFALCDYDSAEEQWQRARRLLKRGASSSDSEDDGFRGGGGGSGSGGGGGGGGGGIGGPEVTDVEVLGLPQIFYASRTHSQIAQFVAEVRKTGHSVRCVTLGSRKNLCANPAVSRLGSEQRITEACLDLQKRGNASKSTATTSTSTPAYGTAKNHPPPTFGTTTTKKSRLRKTGKCNLHSRRLERGFAERALGAMRDIEELAALGHDLGACPYYGSREAVKSAQVVCLPYSMLLHAEAREALGINVTNKIIIIDEAHNLIDAVNALHSADITLPQLTAASAALSQYVLRFQTRLGLSNLRYLGSSASPRNMIDTVIHTYLIHISNTYPL
ncbi:hypothetical protein B484DRAFT_457302 [Ochromonadaceae sp. CCMP2298]|nr:hypothetical protein B484DRAFT_457302 [Ochromonadaceae sp. CCMP2298]